MKKLNLLFMLLAVLFVSCSSDDGDDNGPGDENSGQISGTIVGTWDAESMNYTGEQVTTFQGQSITTTTVGEAYDLDYVMTFTTDPNEVLVEGSYSVSGSSTTLGQSQDFTQENITFYNEGTWEQTDNVITVTYSGTSNEMTILEMNDTFLKLKNVATETSTQQGIEMTTQAEQILTFTKM